MMCYCLFGGEKTRICCYRCYRCSWGVNAQNNRGDEEVKKNDQNMCRRGGSHDGSLALTCETLTVTPEWRNETFCQSSEAKNKPATHLQRVSQH